MRVRFRVLGAATVLAGLALLLGACANGNDNTDTLGQDPYKTEDGTDRVFAEFEPGIQVMPMPNDVVWSADEEPADPAIQLPAEGALAPLALVINAQKLLGLSPNMFLTVPLTGSVDASTLQAFVFRLDGRELPRTQASFQVISDHIADADPSTPHTVVKLLPNTPFTPGAFYGVAVKMGLKDAAGFDVHPSFSMSALKETTPFPADSPFVKFEALRAKFNAPGGLFDGLAQATGAVLGTPWSRDDVLLLWTFHTADLTLDLAAPGTVPPPLPYADFSARTAALKLGSHFAWTDDKNDLEWLTDGGESTSDGHATGVTMLQLYTDLAAQDPTGDVTQRVGYTLQYASSSIDKVYFGRFQSASFATLGLPTPVAVPVPFLLVTPKGGTLPHPVVVFQHGITRDKFDALLTANAFAAKGFAVLAIDAPLHGERGTGFFTANLLQDRANFYQAAVDLWETFDVLEAGALDFEGDGTAEVSNDPEDMRFASQSLGSLIGSVFLSQEERPALLHLVSPGGQIANIVDETRRTDIRGLVESLGYTKGTTSYYVFLNLAQWLLDPTDSMYSGIGGNSTDKLMAVTAHGDPIVSEASSFTFLASIGIDSVTSVPPPFAAPSTEPGAYRYGTAADPVIHFFTLAPIFDPLEEPWYEEPTRYDATVQAQASAAAQAQAADFFDRGHVAGPVAAQ
ncbi:MAG: hypothetical protein HZB55_13505 [Deltaproteobacteria bacterium]|nr:hypothetical protein [Deltaproteobacteria bacterium]